MNLANALTVSRVVLAPVFLLIVFLDRGRQASGGMTALSWTAVVLFVLAASTDLVDGVVARRNNTITDFGKLADPVADKVMVGAALVGLVAFREFPAWAAVVIAVREIAVSALRGVALSRGRVIPAAIGGKIKTAVQIPMVVIWLLPRVSPLAGIQDLVVVVAVVLTIVSGLAYLAPQRSPGPAGP